jgi:hypothetical protein
LTFPINAHLQNVILLENPSNLQETLFGVKGKVFVPSSRVLTKVLGSGTSLTSSSFESVGVDA